MTNIDSNVPALESAHAYAAPRLTVIGNATDVILGFAGDGDDYLGYSFPEFEFLEDASDEHLQ